MKRKRPNKSITPSHMRDAQLKRTHTVSMLLNDKELHVVERYCRKYKVSNRSKLIREALITHILKRFEEDTPTLFD